MYVHCSLHRFSHRFSLSCKHAADQMGQSFLIRFFEALLKLWKHFHYSAKRTSILEEEIGDSSKIKKIPLPSPTRWLSQSRELSAVKELYGPIIRALQHISDSGDVDAFGLLVIMGEFVVTLLVMERAFNETARFSGMVQGIKVDFSQVNVHIHS